MKKFITLLVLAAISICVNAQSKSYITTVNLNMRSSASLSAEVLDVIPKGTEVTTIGTSYDSWSLVIYNGKIGWSRSVYLATSFEPRAMSAITYYTNSSGNKVQSPTYYESVPRGATARCKDGTYSFSQSRRGTCSHHGGVAEWLN